MDAQDPFLDGCFASIGMMIAAVLGGLAYASAISAFANDYPHSSNCMLGGEVALFYLFPTGTILTGVSLTAVWSQFSGDHHGGCLAALLTGLGIGGINLLLFSAPSSESLEYTFAIQGPALLWSFSLLLYAFALFIQGSAKDENELLATSIGVVEFKSYIPSSKEKGL